MAPRIHVRLNDQRDSDIIAWLDRQDDRSAAIRAAIRSNTVGRMRAKEDRAPGRAFKWRAHGLRRVNRGAVEGWRERLEPEHVALIERHAGPTLRELGHSLVGPGSTAPGRTSSD